MIRTTGPRRMLLLVILTATLPALAIERLGLALEKPPAQRSDARGDREPQRLREGTELVDRLGRFELTGDRWTFYMESNGEALRALENLALERITRTLQESRGDGTWRVSGRATEYRGGNYLLVTRAVLQERKEP